MKVVWTQRAHVRLQEIFDYIAQDSPINAARMMDRILRREGQLSEHPRSGRIVPEYQRLDTREIFEGAYRIIYRIIGDQVAVMTVRHSAQMLPSKLD